jgi:hypothetical protein
VGVAGVERQRDLEAVELGDDRGEVRHPAAGVDAGGHVLDAEDNPRAAGVVGEGRERFEEGRATGPGLGRVGIAAGVDNEVRPAGLDEPVDAAGDVVDTALATTGVGVAEVHPLGPDRLAAPAAVGTVEDEAGVGEMGSQRLRVGQRAPVGQDLDATGPQPPGDAHIGLEVPAREAVGDHRADRAGDGMVACHGLSRPRAAVLRPGLSL